jgi:hypothetical protein
MRQLAVMFLSGLAFGVQAHTFQELGHYTKTVYGEDSELYKRTVIIFNQFEKEAKQKLPDITKNIHKQNPELTIQFSNINCGVTENNNDFMPYCTYVFTSHKPKYDAKGIVYGQETNHIFCPVPISLDFKLAVNYTWINVYLPATQAGEDPNLLSYPPAGDPTKRAIDYLQNCLENTFVDKE